MLTQGMRLFFLREVYLSPKVVARLFVLNLIKETLIAAPTGATFKDLPCPVQFLMHGLIGLTDPDA